MLLHSRLVLRGCAPRWARETSQSAVASAWHAAVSDHVRRAVTDRHVTRVVYCGAASASDHEPLALLQRGGAPIVLERCFCVEELVRVIAHKDKDGDEATCFVVLGGDTDKADGFIVIAASALGQWDHRARDSSSMIAGGTSLTLSCALSTLLRSGLHHSMLDFDAVYGSKVPRPKGFSVLEVYGSRSAARASLAEFD